MIMLLLSLIFLAAVCHSLPYEGGKVFPVFAIAGHCILSEEKLVLQPGEEVASTEECYSVKCITADNGETKAEIIHCEEIDSSENKENCALVTNEHERFPGCCPHYECEDTVVKTEEKRQARMEWNSTEAQRFQLMFIACLLQRSEIETFKNYVENSSKDIIEDLKTQIKSGELRKLTDEEEGALIAFFECTDNQHEEMMAHHRERGNNSREEGDRMMKRNAGTDRGHSHRGQRFFLIQVVCLLNQTEISAFNKFINESSNDYIQVQKTQLKDGQLNALNETEEGAMNAFWRCSHTVQSLMEMHREEDRDGHDETTVTTI